MGGFVVGMYAGGGLERSVGGFEGWSWVVPYRREGVAVGVSLLVVEMRGMYAGALVWRELVGGAVVGMREAHAEDALRRFGDAREGLVVPDPVLERFVSQAAMEVERGGGAGRRNLSRNAARP